MTEQTQASLGGPGRPGHLGLEELAALADGRCRSADAARVRAHLASCEECYEVFREAVQLLEELEEEDEEDPVLEGQGESPAKPDLTSALPYPGTRRKEDDSGAWRHTSGPPGGRPREEQEVGPWLPHFLRENLRPHYLLAAGALVIAALGFGIYEWLRPPQFSVDALAAQTQTTGKVQVDKLAWGERTRGGRSGQSSTEDPSFRLGVELLNLQVALQEQDTSSADAAAAAINGLFDSITFADPASKDFYRNLRLRLPKERPEDLSPEAAKEAKDVRNSPSVGDLELDLGSWAEAGRFAAYTRNRAFFDRRSVQHFLDKLPKEQPPAEAITALKTIDAKLAAHPPQNLTDYDSLKSAFDQILRAYYPQGERGGL